MKEPSEIDPPGSVIEPAFFYPWAAIVDPTDDLDRAPSRRRVMTKEGLESCLLEMMIVRKGVGNLSLAHQRK